MHIHCVFLIDNTVKQRNSGSDSSSEGNDLSEPDYSTEEEFLSDMETFMDLQNLVIEPRSGEAGVWRQRVPVIQTLIVLVSLSLTRDVLF